MADFKPLREPATTWATRLIVVILLWAVGAPAFTKDQQPLRSSTSRRQGPSWPMLGVGCAMARR
jgi:hypothetical protein